MANTTTKKTTKPATPVVVEEETKIYDLENDQTVETPTGMPVEVKQSKIKEFGAKAKEGAAKAWNSKPAKVVKTVAVAAGAAVGGYLVAKCTQKVDEAPEQETDDVFAELSASLDNSSDN